MACLMVCFTNIACKNITKENWNISAPVPKNGVQACTLVPIEKFQAFALVPKDGF